MQDYLFFFETEAKALPHRFIKQKVPGLLWKKPGENHTTTQHNPRGEAPQPRETHDAARRGHPQPKLHQVSRSQTTTAETNIRGRRPGLKDSRRCCRHTSLDSLAATSRNHMSLQPVTTPRTMPPRGSTTQDATIIRSRADLGFSPEWPE